MKLTENFTYLNIREKMRPIKGPAEDFGVIRKVIDPRARDRMELLKKGEIFSKLKKNRIPYISIL